MKKIEIYDPALCCSTGVCGPSPQAALPKFASALQQLQGRAHIVRHNLAQEPGAFAAEPIVKKILETEGTGALPVILIEGQLAMKGVYPTASQLRQLLGISDVGCEDAAENGGQKKSGCCGGSSCCGEEMSC